jgi:hypothetical protein
MEIVKVQLAACPDDRDRCLIYAKGRDRITLQRLPYQVRRVVAERGKRYFTAAWSPPAGWTIGEPLHDQTW